MRFRLRDSYSTNPISRASSNGALWIYSLVVADSTSRCIS
jgi:hypothetical protein